jgi:hypothetical protein
VTAIASKICSKCKKKLPATAKFFFRDFKHAKIMNRGRAMKYLYGLKVAEYNRLFSIQNGRCAICGKHQSELKRRLDVDHDHHTDEVRGLLCNCCNKIIERHINSPSWFKNPIIVNRLNEYLK